MRISDVWTTANGLLRMQQSAIAEWAGVAQLVEHQPSKLRVASSNLVARSRFDVGQTVRFVPPEMLKARKLTACATKAPA
jgi:hypothetical protein